MIVLLPAALPTLDVNEGALDLIFSVYKQLLPEMGGYLIQDGRLQHQRLELLLGKLAELELETLEQRASVSLCLVWQEELCVVTQSAICSGQLQERVVLKLLGLHGRVPELQISRLCISGRCSVSIKGNSGPFGQWLPIRQTSCCSTGRKVAE